MPGIAGQICINGSSLDRELTHRMSSLLTHHDWYHASSFHDSECGVSLTHVHLGIIEYPDQPFTSPDGSIRIFLHGEIYDDESEKRNPLEYIYKKYLEHGIDFAAHLNGSFFIVLVDSTEKRVLLANDRTGSKPLFYFLSRDILYFAPELKALLCIPDLEKQLNETAIANFLSCGHFLNGETILQNVNVLDWASVIVSSENKHEFLKYWDMQTENYTHDEGLNQYRTTLSTILRRAVNRHTRSNHNYGILLSGGYDSRGILGYFMEKHGSTNINTISWGENETLAQSDCNISRKIANEMGFNHRFFQLKHELLPDNIYSFIYYHDGLTDALTNYPGALEIFKKIRNEEHLSILLRGDQCFGYSGNFSVSHERSLFRTLGISYLDELQRYTRVIDNDYLKTFVDLNSKALDDISSKCHLQDMNDKGWYFYLDLRHKHYLNMLTYVKSIELEIRNPWIDNEIIDFMRSIPARYRIDKYLYHNTLETMFPTLFTEKAKKQNGIDWHSAFSTSDDLQKYIYRELIEKPGVFDKYLDRNGLKTELDDYFRGTSRVSFKSRLKQILLPILDKVPSLYRIARRFALRTPSDISMELLIVRLLTLKIWCNIFLSPDFGKTDIPTAQNLYESTKDTSQ